MPRIPEELSKSVGLLRASNGEQIKVVKCLPGKGGRYNLDLEIPGRRSATLSVSPTEMGNVSKMAKQLKLNLG